MKNIVENLFYPFYKNYIFWILLIKSPTKPKSNIWYSQLALKHFDDYWKMRKGIFFNELSQGNNYV